MKRFMLVLTMLCVLISAMFAANSNGQKVYSVNDGIYDKIESLALMSGASMPFSAGPWSADELGMMLSLIDYDSLGSTGKAVYDSVKAELEEEPGLVFDDRLGATFAADFTLEGYYNTNVDEFNKEGDWAHGYVYRSPLVNFTSELWSNDHFYFFFEVTVRDRIKENIYDGSMGSFTPNMTCLLPGYGMFNSFEWQWPQRAFASAGGDGWNIMAGRDRLSWGNGLTGNLMLSDTFPVHTFARFTTYHKAFKYSLVASFYPYYSTDAHYDPAKGWLSNGTDQRTEYDGYKTLVVHRLDFKFGKKVNFSIQDACMYLIKDGQAFNLSLVNLFGFMHNEYVSAYGNSLLVLEADYTPVKGLNLYGQFAVDEFQFGEDESLDNMTGLLVGAKSAFELGDGVMTVNAEFARTDPYLYLRGTYYNSENEGVPGVSSTSAPDYGFMALFKSACNQYVENRFTTYTYGNDVIVSSLKADYKVLDKYELSLQGTYIISGILDAYSNWGMYSLTDGKRDPSVLAKSPCTFNPFDSSETGEVEKSFILSAFADARIVAGLSAHCYADLLFVTNKDNQLKDMVKDIQLTFGLTYSI